MKADPILQEIWDVKDRLAAESGYDVDRFVAQLQVWTAGHPATGPVVHNDRELRQFLAEQERQRVASATLALNEKPFTPNKS